MKGRGSERLTLFFPLSFTLTLTVCPRPRLYMSWWYSLFSLSSPPLFLSCLVLLGQSMAVIFYSILHTLCCGSGELVEVCCDLWDSTFEKFLLKTWKFMEVYSTKIKSLLATTCGSLLYKFKLVNTFWVSIVGWLLELNDYTVNKSSLSHGLVSLFSLVRI